MSQLGWHFLPHDARLANDDGREVQHGETLTVNGPLELCANGLHWSTRPLDALGYAPERPRVQRVQPIGETLTGYGKSCSRGRRCLWLAGEAETARMLREFACWCAWGTLLGQAIRHQEPDQRSIVAVLTAERFARGDVGTQELTAAWGATREAAMEVAGKDPWEDSWEDAREAAAAARTDARAAAWDAAWGATWVTAWSAAREAANAELERRLMALMPNNTSAVQGESK